MSFEDEDTLLLGSDNVDEYTEMWLRRARRRQSEGTCLWAASLCCGITLMVSVAELTARLAPIKGTEHGIELLSNVQLVCGIVFPLVGFIALNKLIDMYYTRRP